MKHLFKIVTLYCLIYMYGCANKVEAAKSIVQSLLSKHTFLLPTFSKKYLTYTFEDGNEFQTVQIKWLSKDTIKFSLTADWMPCLFEQNGFAVLRDLPTDKTKKQQGTKLFQEYIVQDSGQLKAICISFPRIAKIEYDYGDLTDECDPDGNVLMFFSAVK
jgi:hypothetical protein